MLGLQQRTAEKIEFAKVHLMELLDYENAFSNDHWENAHQESIFFHLVGSVESLLQEINIAYQLGLDEGKISYKTVRDKLSALNKTSNGFSYLDDLKKDQSKWLSLLYEWRNHGAHRQRLGKFINASTWQSLDNEFKDPRTRERQTNYPGLGCSEVLFRLTTDVEELILHIRSIDQELKAL